jgi:hypothetical protein
MFMISLFFLYFSKTTGSQLRVIVGKAGRSVVRTPVDTGYSYQNVFSRSRTVPKTRSVVVRMSADSVCVPTNMYL